MSKLISKEEAQRESVKNIENIEKINQYIQNAVSQGLFTVDTIVTSFKGFNIVKHYLNSQKFGAIWSKINENLYFIKIYWGPNPKLKSIGDQSNIQEAWTIPTWIKNSVKNPVLDPKTRKPISGKKWSKL